MRPVLAPGRRAVRPDDAGEAVRFNLLVTNHLGVTRTRAICTECASRFPGRLLREPGTGERDPVTGLLLAGPVVVRQSQRGECSECGNGRPPLGYLRCCAYCSADVLLDHPIGNEHSVYCPRHQDPAART